MPLQHPEGPEGERQEKAEGKHAMKRVGIINVTGYAGIELARLLSCHPEVKLASVTGRSAAPQAKRSGFLKSAMNVMNPPYDPP